MKTVYLSEKQNKLYKKFLLNEGQEVKSLKKAVEFILKNWKNTYTFETEKEAEDFLRGPFREKCGAFHNNREAKFYLGAVRLLNDVPKFPSKLSLIGKFVKAICSNEESFKENDINLSKFKNIGDAEAYLEEFDSEMGKKATNDVLRHIKDCFDGGYSVVPIQTYKEASNYSGYTDWCICRDKGMFENYTSNGEIHLYFVLSNNYDDYDSQSYYFNYIREENDTELEDEDLFNEGYCSWDDEYAMSMLAVFVDENGKLTMCVSRYNNDVKNIPNDFNGYSYRDFENYFTEKELSYILGENFSELFPYKQVKKLSKVEINVIKKLHKSLENNNGEFFERNIYIDEYRAKVYNFYDRYMINVDDGYSFRFSYVIYKNDKIFDEEKIKDCMSSDEVFVYGNTVIIGKKGDDSIEAKMICDTKMRAVFHKVSVNKDVYSDNDGKKYIIVEDDGMYLIDCEKCESVFNEGYYTINYSKNMSVGEYCVFKCSKTGEMKSRFLYIPRLKKKIYETEVRGFLGNLIINEDCSIFSTKTCDTLDVKAAKNKHGQVILYGKCLITEKDGKYGIHDESGNEIIKNKFKDFDDCDLIYGNRLYSVMSVKFDGNYYLVKAYDNDNSSNNGIITTSSRPIIPLIKEDCLNLVYNDKDGCYNMLARYSMSKGIDTVDDTKTGEPIKIKNPKNDIVINGIRIYIKDVDGKEWVLKNLQGSLYVMEKSVAESFEV